MDRLRNQMYLLALKFFQEQNYKNAQHELEKLSGLFFDIQYFGELIRKGEWEKVEEYAQGFTHRESNAKSSEMFFAISKQKYLEALDRGDKSVAAQILEDNLKVFEETNSDEMAELVKLFQSRSLRGNRQMRQWKGLERSREALVTEVSELLIENQDICNKLELPKIEGRIEELATQSLKYQYKDCSHFTSDFNNDRATVLDDHQCLTNNSAARPNLGAPGPMRLANIASTQLGALSLVAPNHNMLPASLPHIHPFSSSLVRAPPPPPATTVSAPRTTSERASKNRSCKKHTRYIDE